MSQRIASARFEAGFRTLASLARAVGVSEAAVRKWESGETRPRHDHLRRIAELTGKSIAYFYAEKTPDLTRHIRELQEELRTTITVLNGDASPTAAPIVRIPIVTAGNHDGGVIDVPAMLLPDAPHDTLIAAHADAGAPTGVSEGDVVIAARIDERGVPNSSLVIAVVAEEVVVREAYADGEGQVLLTGRGAPERVPTSALLGRVLRSLSIQDHTTD